MGSGNWPVDTRDEVGKKLVAAARLIKEVLDAVPADDNQFDNAEYDGGYRAEVALARQLVLGAVQEKDWGEGETKS